jgi:hypothetical protein
MIDYEVIFEKVSMEELLEKYGIYKQRKNYVCPFHKDKNPSANILRTDKDWFHCFACGSHFNVIDFVANYEKCDRKTAIAKLDLMFGLGLGNELTPKQKRELELARVKREKEKSRKEKQVQFENETCNKIIEELRLWESIEKICHPTKGEIRNDTWKTDDMFFMSLKRQEWLNWLYDAVCGFDHQECEFDYTIGTDKVELLRKIYKGEVEI